MSIWDIDITKINEIPLLPKVFDDTTRYKGVLIVPNGKIHDSGYKCMTFLFCDSEQVLYRSSGREDLLNMLVNTDTDRWKIDCLPNGIIRVFCNREIINEGPFSGHTIRPKKRGE